MQIVAWSLLNQREFEKSEFKGYYKSIVKGTQNDLKNCETRGQKLSQLYHLQFDAAETCQSRPFWLLWINDKSRNSSCMMNLRSILTRSLFGQTMH